MSRAQEGELRRLVGGSASSLWCGSSSPGRSPRLVVDPERREALVALMVEVATWGQLGIHRKPIGILNVAGYYDPLVGLLDHAVAEGFVSPANRGLLSVDGDPVCLIDRMAAREPPPAPSWITPQEA